ncbi:hypothetical protein SGL43_07374 [Streptomyces globisporus]|uniref:Uncharacterized protein n=1 Tax=Streptomyces globisporus TaxID=1908 RepID=A0ABM9H9E7_STRGL|nr:hypothetical protein SGL43_07374 [Streptomyces globisporus]
MRGVPPGQGADSAVARPGSVIPLRDAVVRCCWPGGALGSGRTVEG